MRSSENLTSSASMSVPSWNVTPSMQVEGVGQPVLGDLPAFGEAGDDAAVGGEARQALEHVGIDHFVDRRGGFGRRVEAGRLEHEADLDVGPRLARAGVMAVDRARAPARASTTSDLRMIVLPVCGPRYPRGPCGDPRAVLAETELDVYGQCVAGNEAKGWREAIVSSSRSASIGILACACGRDPSRASEESTPVASEPRRVRRTVGLPPFAGTSPMGMRTISRLRPQQPQQRQRHDLGGVEHVVDPDILVRLVRQVEDARAVGDAVRAAGRCGRCASGRRCRARRRIRAGRPAPRRWRLATASAPPARPARSWSAARSTGRGSRS